jgi:phosphopantetheinyl transferase (holo-ACP synthase)
MKAPRTVHLFAEIVAVEDVRDDRAAWLSQEEELGLAGKPAMSAAGFVALKRAILRLLLHVAPDLKLGAKDIVLGHAGNGAPVILSTPSIPGRCAAALARRTRVSISHTKTHGCGLAVLEEGADA